MSRLPRLKTIPNETGPPLSPLSPTPTPLKGFWKGIVPILMGLYLLLACLHAGLVPIGNTAYQNAPDEAAHVSYVRTVAEGHLPTQESAAQDTSGPAYEWHQPPLYYFWARLFLPLGPRGMRLASILCGLAALLLIYRTSRLLFPTDPLLSITATGFVALLPTHIAITSTVNNDALLEVCFSATLFLLSTTFLSGFSLRRASWLGVAMGAAFLTKATAILLLPIVLFALVLLWRGGEPVNTILRGASMAFGIFLVLSGWWFVRNQQLYGELLPLKAFDRAFSGTAQASTMTEMFGGTGAYARTVTQWSFQSFWAVLGNPEMVRRKGLPLFLPETIYFLPLLLTLGALAGMTRLHFVRHKIFTDAQLRSLWVFIATFVLVGLSFASFLTKYFQTQGRYLYPAMLPISIIVSLGWLGLFPPKYRNLGASLLFGVLGILTLLFFVMVSSAA